MIYFIGKDMSKLLFHCDFQFILISNSSIEGEL